MRRIIIRFFCLQRQRCSRSSWFFFFSFLGLFGVFIEFSNFLSPFSDWRQVIHCVIPRYDQKFHVHSFPANSAFVEVHFAVKIVCISITHGWECIVLSGAILWIINLVLRKWIAVSLHLRYDILKSRIIITGMGFLKSPEVLFRDWCLPFGTLYIRRMIKLFFSSLMTRTSTMSFENKSPVEMGETFNTTSLPVLSSSTTPEDIVVTGIHTSLSLLFIQAYSKIVNTAFTSVKW